MDSNPWSEKQVSPGTTFTDKADLKDFESRVNKGGHRLHRLKKSGSILEAYGENNRIIVNELRTGSAAIWYGLYDGTILELLEDDDKKLKIEELLHRYFTPPSMPIIPILRRDETADPKFKLKGGGKTRVYSMHGGANLRTFLGIPNNDPYRGDRFLDTYPSLVSNLQQRGVNVPLETPNNVSALQSYEIYLKAQAIAKDELIKHNITDEETKRLVVELELYSKMHVVLGLLEEIGIYHSHPHGGNIVISWSRDSLSKTELERQLVNPTNISNDYEEMIKHYPECTLYPALIDFDAAHFDHELKDGIYDQQKALKLLGDENAMHKVIGIQLLSVEKWPEWFKTSLFSSNMNLIDEVSLKLRSLFFVNKLTPRVIEAIFSPIIGKEIDIQNEGLKRLLSDIIPGRVVHTYNIMGWRNWIKFFRDNPKLVEFKQLFVDCAMTSLDIRDREDLFRVVENTLANDPLQSKSMRLIRSWLGYNVRQALK